MGTCSEEALHAQREYAADSKKLGYGPGRIYEGVPSSPKGFGVGGQSYSNFLAFAVLPVRNLVLILNNMA